jgi:hypothetical protein
MSTVSIWSISVTLVAYLCFADVGVWQQRSPLPKRNGDAPLALCMDRFLFTFGGQTEYNSPKLDELWGLDLGAQRHPVFFFQRLCTVQFS